MPIGQFGTRNLGGKDSASSRYIFTKLNKITRYIFREEDDACLDYVEDDGYIFIYVKLIFAIEFIRKLSYFQKNDITACKK